jgi:hypothetical protein
MKKPTKRKLPTQIFLKYTQMKLALSIRKRKYLHIAGKAARKRNGWHIKRWREERMK